MKAGSAARLRALALGGLALANAIVWFLALRPEARLTVTFLDVGQGDVGEGRAEGHFSKSRPTNSESSVGISPRIDDTLGGTRSACALSFSKTPWCLAPRNGGSPTSM